MRISAKADYAVRAGLELAALPPGCTMNAREISVSEAIPQHFLENILAVLRRAGVVHTQRGAGGGSSLARPAATISIGEVLRVIDGPLAAVRDLPPEDLAYPGAAHNLPRIWCAVHTSLSELLDGVTLADLTLATKAFDQGPTSRFG